MPSAVVSEWPAIRNEIAARIAPMVCPVRRAVANIPPAARYAREAQPNWRRWPMSRSLMTSVTTLGPEAQGFFPHRTLLPVSGRSVDRSVGHPRKSSVWACSDGEDALAALTSASKSAPHEVQTKRALVMRLLLSQGPVESAVTDRRIRRTHYSAGLAACHRECHRRRGRRLLSARRTSSPVCGSAARWAGMDRRS
jgi:hypothetical protein